MVQGLPVYMLAYGPLKYGTMPAPYFVCENEVFSLPTDLSAHVLKLGDFIGSR
jgi:hypothetical protein